ncbi:MAG TPA: primosomal protein N' [Chitinophagales bacterium]|nr:primosomal protein N' [Chitinophagales bacterium]
MSEVFESEITLFAEVILPLSLPKNYTYGIPKEFEEQVAIGKRVEIQFGQRKIYAGLIKRLHHDAPGEYRIKPIISVLDAEPIVSETQLKFWEWMANYYLCAEGDVMNASLPSGFKLESETSIILHPQFNDDFTNLNDREYVVAEALTLHKELSIDEITKILHRKTVYPIIESLMKKNVVIVKENLIERYKPHIETFIRLNPEYSSDEKLRPLFDELEKKAKKQLDVLMSYIHFTSKIPADNQKGKGYAEIEKSDLLEKSKAGSAALNSLIRKKIFIAEKKEVGRLGESEKESEGDFELNKSQAEALQKIKDEFKEKKVVLLHGITSSGKTNLYIRLIEEAIASKKQVLYLLPEIALTAQIVERLRKQFGNKIGIYHSRFNQQERVEIWNKLLRGEYQIILGARSALFLPYENLGLVIIDEEHDSSYKQNDPAPRYHGRDAAIFLASLFSSRVIAGSEVRKQSPAQPSNSLKGEPLRTEDGQQFLLQEVRRQREAEEKIPCKVILGSATPSLESFTNAQNGKFGFVELTERFGNASLPDIIITDIKEAKKKKEMHSHFAASLLDEIKSALSRNEQVIIFQNRRGYAPYLECELCHWVAMCPNCDVHLTYHKFQNELRCHYCGHRKNNFTQCPACGSSKLHITGFGTEKIEDELKIFFPDAAIARLDYDAAKKKGGFQKIIHEFEKGKIQILVGTQMVTKGLDFENVSLVGIMNADQLMGHSDFRTAERGFQLMSQVSGRAGRKNKKGKVILQTSNPNSPLLQFVLAHDYHGFYNEEIKERRKFFYPPFSRIVQLTFKHKEAKKAWEAARILAAAFQKELGKKLLGPAEPVVNRVRNQYLVQLLFKLERSGLLITQTKEKIQNELMKLQELPALRTVHAVVDVDPY